MLAESRKWEGRAKENRAAAKELDELKKSSMTDVEKVEEATRRAEAAEAKVAEYERQRERAGIVAEVAAEKGVDADRLSHRSSAGCSQWICHRSIGLPASDKKANLEHLALKFTADLAAHGAIGIRSCVAEIPTVATICTVSEAARDTRMSNVRRTGAFSGAAIPRVKIDGYDLPRCPRELPILFCTLAHMYEKTEPFPEA